jgi:hypothetical protein
MILTSIDHVILTPAFESHSFHDYSSLRVHLFKLVSFLVIALHPVPKPVQSPASNGKLASQLCERTKIPLPLQKIAADGSPRCFCFLNERRLPGSAPIRNKNIKSAIAKSLPLGRLRARCRTAGQMRVCNQSRINWFRGSHPQSSQNRPFGGSLSAHFWDSIAIVSTSYPGQTSNLQRGAQYF